MGGRMEDAEKVELARVAAHCDQLAEHFDTVQIFVTRNADNETEEEGTVNIQLGRGNWFARYGQVHQWIVKSDEDARIHARREPNP
jgi:hypothetical protein